MVNSATDSALSNGCTIVADRVDSDLDWLRHSKAVDELWRPASTIAEVLELGVTCGPAAFAALARLELEAATIYFPASGQRAWTNRIAMRRALRAIGFDFVHKTGAWPRVGICLVHFTGPWTRRGYPAAVLQNTHWVAVFGDYVFDINWNGWLPRRNWEEVVIEQLLAQKLLADGWSVMVAYEVTGDNLPLGCRPPDFREVHAQSQNAVDRLD
jgi:hypothetical protein